MTPPPSQRPPEGEAPAFDECGVTIYCGDSRAVLRQLPAQSVNCCVTSPPYWGLRDYGVDGQIGLEQTPDAYVAEMVAVFREVRRVLRDDGTLWLNLGDSYAAAPTGSFNGGGFKDTSARNGTRDLSGVEQSGIIDKTRGCGMKPKDLCGIPWLVAFALRADGWYLRSDIIWHKPNPMPESVTDRPTKAHEYLFLLSKSERYFYDADRIREPLAESSIGRLMQPSFDQQTGGPKDYGHRTNSNRSARKALCNLKEKLVASEKWGDRHDGWEQRDKSIGANKRTVWTIPTYAMPEAHFATFPPKLIEPCILAGCPADGVVLDPFFGAGTTGVVCRQQHVRCIGIELNPDYVSIASRRLAQGTLPFTTGAA